MTDELLDKRLTVTITEARQLLGVSRQTILDLLAEGKLRYAQARPHSMILINARSLREFANGQSKPSADPVNNNK